MKSLDITPQIESRIRAVAGEDVQVSDLVVFETILCNTAPLQKLGSIFDKGRISVSMLNEMAESIALSGGVPLQTVHDMQQLPVGKVFHAEVRNRPDGELELRGQFYLHRSETNLLAKLEAGIVDEVSIGATSKSILCSECGWDYRSEEASILNFIERTCANDHVIGKDGVHVRLVGLDRWFETSLVPRGAAQNAKVQSRAKAVLSVEDYERIAASGVHPDAVLLFTSTTTKHGATKMDLDTLFARLDERANETAEIRVELTTAKARIEELEASLTALTQERDELKAQVEADDKSVKLSEAEARVTQLTQDLEAVTAFLSKEAKKALAAAGTPDKEIPENALEIANLISETRQHLHNILPKEGVAQSSIADAQKPASPHVARLSGFKTRR